MGKLGVIEKGAFADIILVEGNPLENIMVLGANKSWFDQADPKPIKTLKLIMKDGKIYKNILLKIDPKFLGSIFNHFE